MSDAPAPPNATKPPPQPRNPLHGKTLEAIVTELAAAYGWDGLAQRVPVRIAIDQRPADIALISGRTATVTLDRSGRGERK